MQYRCIIAVWPHSIKHGYARSALRSRAQTSQIICRRTHVIPDSLCGYRRVLVYRIVHHIHAALTLQHYSKFVHVVLHGSGSRRSVLYSRHEPIIFGAHHSKPRDNGGCTQFTRTLTDESAPVCEAAIPLMDHAREDREFTVATTLRPGCVCWPFTRRLEERPT